LLGVPAIVGGVLLYDHVSWLGQGLMYAGMAWLALRTLNFLWDVFVIHFQFVSPISMIALMIPFMLFQAQKLTPIGAILSAGSVMATAILFQKLQERSKGQPMAYLQQEAPIRGNAGFIQRIPSAEQDAQFSLYKEEEAIRELLKRYGAGRKIEEVEQELTRAWIQDPNS